MKKVLTIAGSDSSGGAGIQADLKTMTGFGVYGMSVITAVTAQNTLGITGIRQIEPEIIEAQMDCVFTDIYPDSVKLGMLGDKGAVAAVTRKLKEYGAGNIVVDPVMASTSGSKFLEEEAIDLMKKELLPKADLVTPNLPEAEALTGMKIRTKKDMEQAAGILGKICPGVLIKGGHMAGGDLHYAQAEDVLYTHGKHIWFSEPFLDTSNTHGTGCTLSSAIASCLALGYSLEESVKLGKKYLTAALSFGLNLGKGNGPLYHFTFTLPQS